MRNLLLSIPGVFAIWRFLGIAYVIIRGVGALLFAILFVIYVVKGLAGAKLAIAYVLFCAQGITIILALYEFRKYRIRNRVVVEKDFEIKESGEVSYSAAEVMRELKKKKEFTESEVNYYLDKYKRSKYKGPEWDKLRGFLLTKRQSAQSFVIEGNTVTW